MPAWLEPAKWPFNNAPSRVITVGDLKTSEDALIRRAQALEPGALAEIYDRFFDAIYRYLYLRVGHRADAEDLTEQVFLKMLDAIPGYRSRGVPFSTWLYRIAHNLVIDRFRRRSRQAVELSDQLQDRGLHSDPEAMLQSSEVRQELYAAIRQLTDEQRQVIILRFIENLEVQQVAQIMKRRPGAIHAMQHRALASLHRILQGKPRVATRRA